jgi:plasmid stabilization system protein ParE
VLSSWHMSYAYSPEVLGVLSHLRTTPPSLERVIAEVVEWGRQEQEERLRELFEALGQEQPGSQQHRHALRTVARQIENTLARAPGLRNVQALLSLMARAREGRPWHMKSAEEWVRGLASSLGSEQPEQVLLEALEQYGGDAGARELLACWMYEAIAGGISLEGREPARRFRERLADAGHPLARLPLTLTDLEYGRPSSKEVPEVASSTDDVLSEAREIDDEQLWRRLAAAVLPWQDESNGQIEAGVFTLYPPVQPGAIDGRLLLSLGLDCLEGADAASLVVRRVTSEDAFDTLFMAAANGGAYGGALQKAYGRLEAWRSLEALSGAGDDASVDEIASRAEACTWLEVEPGTRWFQLVAWDLGLAALRPDGASVAVLAATDTD